MQPVFFKIQPELRAVLSSHSEDSSVSVYKSIAGLSFT